MVSLEKRLNLISAVFLLIYAAFGAILFKLTDHEVASHVFRVRVLLPLGLGLLLFIVHPAPELVLKIVHIISFITLFVTTSLWIDASIYGIGWAFGSLYIFHRYNVFGRFGLIMIFFLMWILLFTMELALSDKSEPGALASITLTGGFLFFLYYSFDYTPLKNQLIREEELRGRIQEENKESSDPETMGFSPREMEVGAILCETLGPDKEIAARLNISISTVVSHMNTMRRKAGVTDRLHLIEKIKGYYKKKLPDEIVVRPYHYRTNNGKEQNEVKKWKYATRLPKEKKDKTEKKKKESAPKLVKKKGGRGRHR